MTPVLTERWRSTREFPKAWGQLDLCAQQGNLPSTRYKMKTKTQGYPELYTWAMAHPQHTHMYRWTHAHVISEMALIYSVPCPKSSSNSCPHISRSHRRHLLLLLSSNSNAVIGQVCQSHWRYISRTTQRCFEIKHHTKKYSLASFF